ncbi:hypothetical protein HMPREF3291_23260 [Bacillus sp. HMSC76G11]|nr:hypothetical protein HMPREF3291_23260 [Bacillus sp. HMSC76G11]
MNEKRLNAFLFLSSILFIFSMLSMVFPIDDLIKDIVFSIGFLIAIMIHLYFRNQRKKAQKKNA